MRKGAWSKDEDEKLKRAVEELGDKNWVRIEKLSGLARPAKNCRLRWFNYLRPNLNKSPFTQEEQHLIFHFHAQYGNAWSRIASKLPGRSDNDIKNFWHKRAKKRATTTFVSEDPCIQFDPPHPHASTQLTNIEIIHQLREAQARVRLLKKKLKQTGISNTNQTHLFTTSTQNNSRIKDDIQYSHSKASLEKGFEREEQVSIDKIFNIKHSETFPHHNWNLWGDCSSSLFQELEGDLFAQSSQIQIGAVYSQSSATTRGGNPGDESGDGEYFKWVSPPTAIHESMGSHDSIFQTFGENSTPTQSSFVQDQYHQPHHSSGEETWKQELDLEDLWVEDDKFFLDRYHFTC